MVDLYDEIIEGGKTWLLDDGKPIAYIYGGRAYFDRYCKEQQKGAVKEWAHRRGCRKVYLNRR